MASQALTLANLRPAVFGTAPFEHFANSDHPRCFACNSRRMEVRPLDVTPFYTLAEAIMPHPRGSRWIVMPSSWVVYPRRHVTSFLDLPPDWTYRVQQALRTLHRLNLATGAVTFGYNDGVEAGQTVTHGHTWIIARGEGEAGLECELLGYGTVIARQKFRAAGILI